MQLSFLLLGWSVSYQVLTNSPVCGFSSWLLLLFWYFHHSKRYPGVSVRACLKNHMPIGRKDDIEWEKEKKRKEEDADNIKKNSHECRCMYLAGQWGYAQSYPAPAHAARWGADGTNRLLTPWALTSWAQPWAQWAWHGAGCAEWHGASQARHFVHRSKETMKGLAVKVSENSQNEPHCCFVVVVVVFLCVCVVVVFFGGGGCLLFSLGLGVVWWGIFFYHNH